MNCRSFKRWAIICALTTALAWICVPAAHASQPTVSKKADIICASPTDTVPERLTRYERNTLRRVQRWSRLIPSYTKLQFAGGMGLLSVGTGWEYGKNRQWETDLLLGIIPKHSSKRTKVTFTLKQNFTPWRVPLRGRFSLEPLSAGLYLNIVLGGEFWMKNPDPLSAGLLLVLHTPAHPRFRGATHTFQHPGEPPMVSVGYNRVLRAEHMRPLCNSGCQKLLYEGRRCAAPLFRSEMQLLKSCSGSIRRACSRRGGFSTIGGIYQQLY